MINTGKDLMTTLSYKPTSELIGYGEKFWYAGKIIILV